MLVASSAARPKDDANNGESELSSLCDVRVSVFSVSLAADCSGWELEELHAMDTAIMHPASAIFKDDWNFIIFRRLKHTNYL